MTNWTEADLTRLGRTIREAAAPQKIPAFGTLKPQRGMNKLEARYDAHLWAQRGRLYVWHAYEGITFKLAHDTRYTPDFAVQTISGAIELHECKGSFWREDSRIKIKVAAKLFPFRFIGITEVNGGPTVAGGGWKVEEF